MKGFSVSILFVFVLCSSGCSDQGQSNPASMRTSPANTTAAISTSVATVALPLADTTPHLSDDEMIAVGKFLVAYGDCSGCHTPWINGPNGPEPDLTRFLSGSPAENANLPCPPDDPKHPGWGRQSPDHTKWCIIPDQPSYAANLTFDNTSFMPGLDVQNFIQIYRTGRHMGHGNPIMPPMPWQTQSTASDLQLTAVYMYLKSIPHVKNVVPGTVYK